jgi:capsular polysaccharide biosynthesis protein/MinD-like ATPase involved in chromosome partitioning or flagellar assembly
MATGDLIAALRHRWWVVVILALLGLTGAAVAVRAIPPTYEATTTVLVTPTGEEQATSTSGREKLVNLDTESQILTSVAVSERVRAALRSPRSATDLASDITVEVPPNTTVLAITATAPTAADAQRESRAFARGYLDQRSETAKAAIAAQMKILQARIAEVTKRLQAVTGQSVTLPQNSPDRAYAEAQQRILIDQTTSLSDDLSKLQAITVTPGRVLSDAALPDEPAQPATYYLAAGLLLGLVLGFAVALLLARLDRRVRRPGDIQALGDVPLLGAIPAARAKKGSVPTIAASASPIGQAFGQIRNDITTVLRTRPATLLVAGTEPGVATSFVAANLAVALARSGMPVLLVCADLGGSSAERLLGLEGLTPAKGLAEALAGDVDPATLLRAAPVVPGLWVLGAGRARDNAVDRLQSRQLEWVLEVVRRDSIVLLESPPTSAGAEAQAMARLCDAAVLVAEASRSRIDAVDAGAHQFARVGTPLLGVVVVERQGGPARKPAKASRAKEASGVSLPNDATIAIRVGDLAASRQAAGLDGEAGGSGGGSAGEADGPDDAGSTRTTRTSDFLSNSSYLRKYERASGGGYSNDSGLDWTTDVPSGDAVKSSAGGLDWSGGLRSAGDPGKGGDEAAGGASGSVSLSKAGGSSQAEETVPLGDVTSLSTSISHAPSSQSGASTSPASSERPDDAAGETGSAEPGESAGPGEAGDPIRAGGKPADEAAADDVTPAHR